MVAKFTPGPWIVDDGTIEAGTIGSESNKVIGSVVTGLETGSFRVGSKEEQLANACLIAAAPDLYSACDELREVLSEITDQEEFNVEEGCTSPDDLCGHRLCDEVGCIIDKLRRSKVALIKATGEEA